MMPRNVATCLGIMIRWSSVSIAGSFPAENLTRVLLVQLQTAGATNCQWREHAAAGRAMPLLACIRLNRPMSYIHLLTCVV